MDGYLVEVEAETTYGQPSVSIVDLGDMAVKEAKERLQAALSGSRFKFPKMKVVINLAPGDIKKSGSHFNLPMAIAAKNMGIPNLIVSVENLQEASLVKGIDVVGLGSLQDVCALLSGEATYCSSSRQPFQYD